MDESRVTSVCFFFGRLHMRFLHGSGFSERKSSGESQHLEHHVKTGVVKSTRTHLGQFPSLGWIRHLTYIKTKF